MRDTDFTNGAYKIFRKPLESKILFGINSNLCERLGNSDFQELKHLGELNYKGENSVTYPFKIDSAWNSERSLEYLIQAITREFEGSEQRTYRIEREYRTFSIEKKKAVPAGALYEYRDSFDFEFEGGLKKLTRNLIVEARINMINYNGNKSSTGDCLESYSCSNIWKEKEGMKFNAQFYGFASLSRYPTKYNFDGFRDTPGQSGWDCDVTGNSSFGLKYHRIVGSKTEEYSFKNEVGKLKCALGVLQDADSIVLLDLDQALSNYSR